MDDIRKILNTKIDNLISRGYLEGYTDEFGNFYLSEDAVTTSPLPNDVIFIEDRCFYRL